MMNKKRSSRRHGAVPEEVKKEEGRKLKAKWQAYKERTGETQDAFAERLGTGQGFLQMVFKGKAATPLDILLDMAIEMDFDPREIRPDLDNLIEKMNLAIGGKDAGYIESRINRLPKDLRESAVNYLEFLASQKENGD